MALQHLYRMVAVSQIRSQEVVFVDTGRRGIEGKVERGGHALQLARWILKHPVVVDHYRRISLE